MRSSVRDFKGGGRIIRGTVSSSGTVASGTGFTAVRNSTGNYTITFLVPFAAPPVVVAQPFPGVNNTRFTEIGSVSTTQVNILMIDTTQAFVDIAFTFTATEQER